MLMPNITGYELHLGLGGGPFTHAIAGRDLATGRRVVLKLPRSVEFADSLIRREGAVGLAVQHTHLVRVRRVHLTAAPYVVLDFVDGTSLRDVLRRHYCLPTRKALWIIRQVAEALAALHRAGYMHGDVKPENVLVTPAGSAVLIDLGYARHPGENVLFRQQGIILGTADYLAPESCDLAVDGEPSADIFGLGVMLFEMLTGRLPFASGTMSTTLQAHRQERPLDLKDVSSNWPPALRCLLRSLLARRPQGRPSATALVHELTRLEIRALAA